MSDQVVAYERRSLPEGRRLDTVPLDLPARQFATRALWFVPPDELMEEAGGDLLGALHAAEHALISVLPLLAMCDRWDIGGLSTNLHPQTLRPTVFVYDGHAGGVGIAQRGHDRFAELVASAARVVGDCRCRDGCPSCVQSPKCGNLNEMLDKGAAARLLGAMERAQAVPAGARQPALRARRNSARGRRSAHGQGPEPQERVHAASRAAARALRSRGTPRARGSPGSAGPPAASRTRSRTRRAPGRADARRPTRPCRPPRSAPECRARARHAAAARRDRQGGPRRARRPRPAPRSPSTLPRSSSPVVPGARRASSSKQPSRISVYSQIWGCEGSALPSRSRQPTVSAADPAALAVAQAAEHARGVREERRLVARRERQVGLGLHARGATACGAGPSAP